MGMSQREGEAECAGIETCAVERDATRSGVASSVMLVYITVSNGCPQGMQEGKAATWAG